MAVDIGSDAAVPFPGASHACSARFGDTLRQFAYGVAVDAGGNIVIAGGFAGSIDFGGGALTSAGSRDAFIAKFDSTCAHVWSKRFGNVEDQVFTDVAVDALGNIVVTGTVNGTVDFGGGPLTGGLSAVTAKFSSTGAHLWSLMHRASANVSSEEVAIGPGGVVAIAGRFSGGTLNLGGSGSGPSAVGSEDAYVALFDAAGAPLWSRTFGVAGAQTQGRGIAIDDTGRVILVGANGGANFGGGALAAGGFIASFSATGAHSWSKSFPGVFALDDVAIGLGTEIAVSGELMGSANLGGGVLTSAGANDVVVAKFAASGAHLWSHAYGNASVQQSAGIASDAYGNVVLSAAGAGTLDFGTGALTKSGTDLDVFLVSFDAAGNAKKAVRFGDAASQFIAPVAIGASGEVVLAGGHAGTIDFGGGPLTSAGQEDVFLARFVRP